MYLQTSRELFWYTVGMDVMPECRLKPARLLLKFNRMTYLKIIGTSFCKILFIAFCLTGAFSPDVHGQDYRAIGRSHYRVIDTAGFYLYSIDKLVQGEKIARPQTVYYFSRKADDPVQELTLVNLEQAFASNTGFRYRLESWSRSDKDLIFYDKRAGAFAIKVLYSMSAN